MADDQIDSERRDSQTTKSQPGQTQQKYSVRLPPGRFALSAAYAIDRASSVIYAIVGICFLLAGLFSLIYTFWVFSISTVEIRNAPGGQQPGLEAQAIIAVISGLLLVLIILEMLGTVIHYLRVHTTSARPFLFIGIISATRSILSTGARLSIAGWSAKEFMNGMIELGVSAAVILALGITLKLMSGLFEDTDAQ